MRSRAFLSTLFGRFLVLWFILTIPIVGVLAVNKETRCVFLETLVHWRSKVVPLHYVFIGDSITAGGRNWGWHLWGNPLAARCLAESAFTVSQVDGEAHDAIRLYHPRVVFVMAGVNDLLTGGDPDKALANYGEMLDLLLKARITPIVTLVPYNNRGEASSAITAFNQKLLALCHDKGVATVDLNPAIAPNGILLPQYTTDGVHFTPATYAVWRAKLKEALAASHS